MAAAARIDVKLNVGKPGRRFVNALLPWLVVCVSTIALAIAGKHGILQPLVVYPDHWVVPIEPVITNAIDWLVHDASFGLFTFHQLTRALSGVVAVPLDVLAVILATGSQFSVAGLVIHVPHISWLGSLIATAILGLRYGGLRLALLLSGCVLYTAVFGQWDSAMVTLASVAISVPLGVIGGLLLGIAAYRRVLVGRMIRPCLDFMQTVPVFAYLVPILVLFGFGPVSAMIATIIYAMPPMVRITILALERVPTEVMEYSHMAGCTRRQRMWKVLLPVSSPTLMVGVNQVVMLSLNMVIIASMIGAGGLGHDVLSSLHNLAIGRGAAAGLAITAIAIALDNFIQAAVRGDSVDRKGHPWYRDKYVVAAVFICGVLTLAGSLFPALVEYPNAWQLSFDKPVDAAVDWVNIHWGAALYQMKAVLLIFVLVPFKRFMLGIPWIGVLAAFGLLGYRMGRWRVALPVLAWGIFIVVTGYWQESVTAVYLCGVSVVICCLLGIPFGILTGLKPGLARAVKPALDFLQTLPSFVYLIPVVMLFQVGSFAGIIAIVLYAMVPVIRYTGHGIRNVPHGVIEASRMCGSTRSQILWKVRVPLALPEIMLGINQTIMLALSMLVITALIGTTGLGQQVYIALTRADTGMGLIAGTCVAALAMMWDRIIAAWARRRKDELGLP